MGCPHSDVTCGRVTWQAACRHVPGGPTAQEHAGAPGDAPAVVSSRGRASSEHGPAPTCVGIAPAAHGAGRGLQEYAHSQRGHGHPQHAQGTQVASARVMRRGHVACAGMCVCV